MNTRAIWVVWLVMALAGITGRADGAAQGKLGPAEVQSEAASLRRQLLDLGMTPSEVRNAVDACVRGGFTPGETARVLGLLAKALLAGLPHHDLLARLYEGVAKGVDPPRVLNVLEETARTLRDAKRLVDRLVLEGFSAPDYGMAVQMVADALAAGAPPSEVLRSIREDRPLPRPVPDVRQAFRSGPRRPRGGPGP